MHLHGSAAYAATFDWFVYLQPDIPHIEEHVSKVECVGLQTQQKLLDISAAAAAVGIHNLSVVHNCVTTGAPTLLIKLLLTCYGTIG